MKNISIFIICIIALLACIGFTACNNDVVEIPEPETYTVHLGWSGEINVSYEPMSRAATNDLYGIQVYSKPTSDSTAGGWTPYAYGLFDDPNNITITLQSGSKYKFVATMVRDGKNVISEQNDGCYDLPFSLDIQTGPNSWTSDPCPLSNKFEYQASIFFEGLEEGKVYQGAFYGIPNTDRFYGELSGYIPGDDNSNAKIEMKRASFGAKFIVTGQLAVDGKLEIQIVGAPKMELALTTGDDEISDIFTFDDVYAAWADDKYTETINVTFNWNRTDGSVRPLGTHPVTFKRNTTTVVEVKLENEGVDEGLDFDIDDSEAGTMPTGEVLTIIDGEVVDTEVEVD